ncbi:MAG: hypothetical protein CR975_03845 [Gammaproteobacteria bacterium]|nr:MAG: hypothetical protein CR975_03845 [Gammaproteobacteria bacterium]
MKRVLFIILVLLALVVTLTLSFNNSQQVVVDYVLGQYQLPLSWVMFGAFILGVLIALPFFAFTGWVWKLKAKKLQKQIDEILKQRQRDEIAQQFHQEKQH